jgi:poly-gamma-glutamate capsule biosynthesis protein CapA/YwtB (metallophosphatase superfamily)
MKRRQFLVEAGKLCTAFAIPMPQMTRAVTNQPEDDRTVTLFLCGDVMTGRGIDQVLPHPSDPRIHEPYMRNALGYVELAEQRNGPIPKPVDFAYIWGDALEVLRHLKPDLRLINLETSITASDDYWPGKGINYRMHPDNVPCLTAAQIDGCALANNHVLDWGYAGFDDTLTALRRVGIQFAGAGPTPARAQAPALFDVEGKGRIVLFSFGSPTSGVPLNWAASGNRPGINFLKDFSTTTVKQIGTQIHSASQPGDIVVASIHWGSNWGYRIPRDQQVFAHRLIDEAGVNVLHGHSSHHPRAIEIYRDRPIIYGCGDFLNDYEGIRGYEDFRADLVLMYFVTLEPASGKLVRFWMVPMQIKRFRLNHTSKRDAQWLAKTLHRQCEHFGGDVELNEAHLLSLNWQ